MLLVWRVCWDEHDSRNWLIFSILQVYYKVYHSK